MKVYLVYSCGDFTEIVFASQEKAEAFIAKELAEHLATAVELNEEPFITEADYRIREVDVQ